MIKRVRIQNYKSLADCTVELGPLTVLVGKNGSGKSNFLDALGFVRDVEAKGVAEAIPRQHNMDSLKYDPAEDIQISIDLEAGRVLYTLHGTPDTIPTLAREATAAGGSPDEDDKRLDAVRAFVRGITVYNPHPPAMRVIAPRQYADHLASDGSNLGSILYTMQEEHPALFAEYQAMVRAALPEIEHISVENAHEILFVLVRYASGKTFQHMQESDGTLRIMALIAAMYQPHTPSLIAIEEPELYIYPRILAVLCELIEEASLNTQVVVTTHSPDMISRFSSNVIRVVEKHEQGRTNIAFLDAKQLDVINEQIFSAGDLLRIEDFHRDADSPAR